VSSHNHRNTADARSANADTNEYLECDPSTPYGVSIRALNREFWMDCTVEPIGPAVRQYDERASGTSVLGGAVVGLLRNGERCRSDRAVVNNATHSTRGKKRAVETAGRRARVIGFSVLRCSNHSRC
jgi:hypothetical protein